MRRHRSISLPALTLAGLLALTACTGEETGAADTGSGDTGETVTAQEASSDVNDADVQFASMMVPHHQQAVMMSQLALDQGGPQVAALAERIRDAQGPEIETMTQWLADWGAEPPMGMGDMDMETHDMGNHDMDDMGGMQMEGMMSPQDMRALMAAEGEEFDTMWLEMMIEHHEGAVTMAQRQQAEGENPDAIDLARTMEQDQTAEIAEMEELLQR